MADYKKTYEKLKTHLEPGETIEATVYGMFTANGNVYAGILAATSKKVILFRHGWFSHYLQAVPYQKITSVENTKKVTGYHVVIHTPGADVTVSHINAGHIDNLIAAINSRL